MIKVLGRAGGSPVGFPPVTVGVLQREGLVCATPWRFWCYFLINHKTEEPVVFLSAVCIQMLSYTAMFKSLSLGATWCLPTMHRDSATFLSTTQYRFIWTTCGSVCFVFPRSRAFFLPCWHCPRRHRKILSVDLFSTVIVKHIFSPFTLALVTRHWIYLVQVVAMAMREPYIPWSGESVDAVCRMSRSNLPHPGDPRGGALCLKGRRRANKPRATCPSVDASSELGP